MNSDCQNKIKKKDIFNNYQQSFDVKICDEINFVNFLDEKDVKNYERFKNPKCNKTPKSLLIFSIIIVILTCAGLYFSISRNEGYKQYKQLLEKNLTLVKVELPSEYENKKLVAYLTRDKFESNDDNSCSYIEYSISLCKKENYTRFCNEKRYSEKKCNYMDHQYFLNEPFICTLENYNDEKCSEIQYLDQLEKEKSINEDYKIKYDSSSINFNIKEYYYIEKIWCKIGNYDIPILLSFLIIMVLFIILLIVDLCIDKANLIIGIQYYILLVFYMIYHFIFIIYYILLLALFALSTIVSFYAPNISDVSSKFIDPFFFPQNEDITNSVTTFWKDKRIYAFIYCGINLILFIFVTILSNYYMLLFKYLSFDFEKDSNSAIFRKASIKIGKNNYVFDIFQNKNIYLKDRRENEKFYFKEIMYDNNIIYLKFNNTGIKDQLSWIEYNYPIANYGFMKLFICLELLVLSYIISIIILPKFHIKDDIFYKYFLHLYELGYKPYLYDNLQKLGELQISFYYLIKYIFLVIGILILFSLFKWTFYGGFSNIIQIWIAFFISIFINLINLAFAILSFLLLAYSIINRITLERKINFNYDLMFSKFMASIILYFTLSLSTAILFAISLRFSIFLNSVRKETKKLENDELGSENVFKVRTLNNENFIFQAINSDKISKHLFYIKKRDENPIINNHTQIIDQSSNLFYEQSQEQLLDKKMQLELKNFKINYKNGLSGNILSILII